MPRRGPCPCSRHPGPAPEGATSHPSNRTCQKSRFPLLALAPSAGSRQAAPGAAPSHTALLARAQGQSPSRRFPYHVPGRLYSPSLPQAEFFLFFLHVCDGASPLPSRCEPLKHFEFWTVIQALTAPSTAPTNLTHDTTGAAQGTSKVSLTANSSARRRRDMASAGSRVPQPCGDLTDTGRASNAHRLLVTASLLSASLRARLALCTDLLNAAASWRGAAFAREGPNSCSRRTSPRQASREGLQLPKEVSSGILPAPPLGLLFSKSREVSPHREILRQRCR